VEEVDEAAVSEAKEGGSVSFSSTSLLAYLCPFARRSAGGKGKEERERRKTYQFTTTKINNNPPSTGLFSLALLAANAPNRPRM
jgi:hypothetical protein